MHALKAADDGTATLETPSLRHRALRALPAEERPTAVFGDDDRDASSIIALLADALEKVAETTIDAASREIAEDALALFAGR